MWRNPDFLLQMPTSHQQQEQKGQAGICKVISTDEVKPFSRTIAGEKFRAMQQAFRWTWEFHVHVILFIYFILFFCMAWKCSPEHTHLHQLAPLVSSEVQRSFSSACKQYQWFWFFFKNVWKMNLRVWAGLQLAWGLWETNESLWGHNSSSVMRSRYLNPVY